MPLGGHQAAGLGSRTKRIPAAQRAAGLRGYSPRSEAGSPQTALAVFRPIYRTEYPRLSVHGVQPLYLILDTRTLFRQLHELMDRMSLRETHEELCSNSIVYTYPGGQMDIICASDMVFHGQGWEESCAKPVEKAKRQKGKKSEGDDMLRSMRRARANLRRLALSNDFQYFVTLTLDPAKIDRYDGAAVTRALSHWCDNMARRHGLRYVLVPERHKDSAFHFHGFFAGSGLQAVDSGHTDKRGHTIFNLPQWTLGHTAAIALYDDYASAVGYVCKYIGKQDGERPLGRWYYSGGALKAPAKEYLALDYRQLAADFGGEAVELEIPGSKMLVIHTKTEV